MFPETDGAPVPDVHLDLLTFLDKLHIVFSGLCDSLLEQITLDNGYEKHVFNGRTSHKRTLFYNFDATMESKICVPQTDSSSET